MTTHNHALIEPFAEALRDYLSRRLAPRLVSNEGTVGKPTLMGLAIAPFTGATGETIIVELNGTATPVTITGDDIATAIIDINAAVANVTASEDDCADEGSRLQLQGDTEAVAGTEQVLKVTGGTGLVELGFEPTDAAYEVAIPTFLRANIHTFDVTKNGTRSPTLPCLFLGRRSSARRRAGSERIHDLEVEMLLWVSHTRPEVLGRWVDRIPRAISELIAEDESIDGVANQCRIEKDVLNPIAGWENTDTVAGARMLLTATIAE